MLSARAVGEQGFVVFSAKIVVHGGGTTHFVSLSLTEPLYETRKCYRSKQIFAQSTASQGHRTDYNSNALITSCGAAAYSNGSIEAPARPWLKLRMALE